jgi:hypothetical protein
LLLIHLVPRVFPTGSLTGKPGAIDKDIILLNVFPINKNFVNYAGYMV